MYNLPTLQQKHPKLKQLNNWTQQRGYGLFEGIDPNDPTHPNSSPSQTQVTCFDLGNGGGSHLSRKALPPIAGTTLPVKVDISSSEDNIIPSKRHLKTVAFSPLSLLPLEQNAKGTESSGRQDVSDVYQQASKHIQNYKDDVRRIDECLQNAKQQQDECLLEKIKARQQLKGAEEEERKQREDLESKISSMHLQEYKDDIRRVDECLKIAKQQQTDSLLEKRKARQQLKEAEMRESKQRDRLESNLKSQLNKVKRDKQEEDESSEKDVPQEEVNDSKKESKEDMAGGLESSNCNNEEVLERSIHEQQTASTVELKPKEDPSRGLNLPQVTSNLVEFLDQRKNNIQWVKIEGKRKKTLFKHVKLAVILLLVILLTMLILLLKDREKTVTLRKIGQNETLHRMESAEKQIGEANSKVHLATNNINGSLQLNPSNPSLPATASSRANTGVYPTSQPHIIKSLSDQVTTAATGQTTSSSSHETSGVPSSVITETAIKGSKSTYDTVTPTNEQLPTTLVSTIKRAYTSFTNVPGSSKGSATVPSTSKHQTTASESITNKDDFPFSRSPGGSTTKGGTTETSTTEYQTSATDPTTREYHPTLSSSTPGSSTPETTVDLEETFADAEGVCQSTFATTNWHDLQARIWRLSKRICRMLRRRYFYYSALTHGNFRRRGERMLRKVCDLVQNPGSGGMLMVDLQTMIQQLMDLLGIAYNCV